jgi:hypothetical protein
MKVFRRIIAIVAILGLAIKGVLSFLSWVEKQDSNDSLWDEEEELEEAF